MHASKGLAIIMNQLQSIYNSPFKVSHSHPIHNCFPIIASNGTESLAQIFVGQVYYSPVHANILIWQLKLKSSYPSVDTQLTKSWTMLIQSATITASR